MVVLKLRGDLWGKVALGTSPQCQENPPMTPCRHPTGCRRSSSPGTPQTTSCLYAGVHNTRAKTVCSLYATALRLLCS